MRRGDDLQKPQVAGRVEEMCAAKMLFEILAPAFGHHVDGYARSVGSDQGPGLAVFLHLLKDQLLDVQPLHHHLDHPVAGADLLHVVIEVAGADALHYILRVYRGGVALECSLQGVIDEFVPGLGVLAFLCVIGYDVQQQDLHADAREMAGYP